MENNFQIFFPKKTIYDFLGRDLLEVRVKLVEQRQLNWKNPLSRVNVKLSSLVLIELFKKKSHHNPVEDWSYAFEIATLFLFDWTFFKDLFVPKQLHDDYFENYV